MTEPAARRAGYTFSDVFGTEIWLQLAPAMKKCTCGEHSHEPVVALEMSGQERVIPAGHAWDTGFDLTEMAMRVSGVVLPGGILAGVSFSCSDIPPVNIPPETAREIGRYMVTCAVTAMHLITVYNHLTIRLGHDPEEVVQVISGMDPVDWSAYIR